MTDKTQAMDRLIKQDADLIDVPTQSDALVERKLPQDVIDFIEQTTLLATNHGGWFDPHGFKAISPLCDKGNALLCKYCPENGEQSK